MRTFFLHFSIITLSFSGFFVSTKAAHAEESYSSGAAVTTPAFRFNNENWFTEEHPEVASFTVRDDGSAYGTLETGVPFVQYNVPNELGIKIQRFEIEDHYHYIVDGEIAYSQAELSIKLAEAYTRRVSHS